MSQGERRTVRSQILKRDIDVWTWCEDACAPGRLCIFLDGEFYTERMSLADWGERTVRSGADPCSFLFVSHGNAEARQRDFTCSEDYTRFLVDELVPWGRAQGIGDERLALITGLSLSGLAAAYAALISPETFEVAICQSPSAWWRDEWLQHAIQSMPRPLCRFWISVGTRETEADIEHPPTALYQGVSQRASCRRLATRLSELGAEVRFREFDGGHELGPWEDELPEALLWGIRSGEV